MEVPDVDEEAIRQVLGEQLLTEIQTIRELVSVIPSMDERLGRVERDVVDIKGELVVHRQILQEHSADLTEIKQIVGGHAEAITELKAVTHTH